MRRPVMVPVTASLLEESMYDPSRGSVATVAAQSHKLVSAGSIPAPATIFRSYDEIVAFIEKFTYKPNCKIRAWVDGSYLHPRLFINMVVTVPDSTTEDHNKTDIAFTQTYDLSYIMKDGPRYVFQMMERFVEDWERHESKEWLAFDGTRLVDPHA